MPSAATERPSLKRRWAYVEQKLFGSQLKRNMISASGLSGLSALITALSYTVYLNLLGYEQYGVWLVLSMVVSFYQIGNLGISQGVAKKVAEFNPRENRAEIREYVSTGTMLMAAVGAVLVTVISLFRPEVVRVLHITGHNAELVTKLLPITAVFSAYIFIVDIANNALIGLGRLDLCYACQVGLQALTFALATLAIKSGFGVTGMLVANCVSYLSLHVVSLMLARRLTGGLLLSPFAFCAAKARLLLNFGGWLFGSTLLGLLMSPVNRSVLTRYASLAAVPLYDIPFNSCLRIRGLVDSSQRALISEVSALSANRNTDYPRIQRITAKALRILAVSSLAFVLLGVVITPLLKIWLRSRYVPEMTTSFRVMLAGAFFGLLGVPAYYTMLGLGKGKQIFASNLVQTVLNFMVLLYFVRQPGGVTAVHLLMAATLGYAGSTIWLLVALRHTLHTEGARAIAVA